MKQNESHRKVALGQIPEFQCHKTGSILKSMCSHSKLQWTFLLCSSKRQHMHELVFNLHVCFNEVAVILISLLT